MAYREREKRSREYKYSDTQKGKILFNGFLLLWLMFILISICNRDGVANAEKNRNDIEVTIYFENGRVKVNDKYIKQSNQNKEYKISVPQYSSMEIKIRFIGDGNIQYSTINGKLFSSEDGHESKEYNEGDTDQIFSNSISNLIWKTNFNYILAFEYQKDGDPPDNSEHWKLVVEKETVAGSPKATQTVPKNSTMSPNPNISGTGLKNDNSNDQQDNNEASKKLEITRNWCFIAAIVLIVVLIVYLVIPLILSNRRFKKYKEDEPPEQSFSDVRRYNSKISDSERELRHYNDVSNKMVNEHEQRLNSLESSLRILANKSTEEKLEKLQEEINNLKGKLNNFYTKITDCGERIDKLQNSIGDAFKVMEKELNNNVSSFKNENEEKFNQKANNLTNVFIQSSKNLRQYFESERKTLREIVEKFNDGISKIETKSDEQYSRVLELASKTDPTLKPEELEKQLSEATTAIEERKQNEIREGIPKILELQEYTSKSRHAVQSLFDNAPSELKDKIRAHFHNIEELDETVSAILAHQDVGKVLIPIPPVEISLSKLENARESIILSVGKALHKGLKRLTDPEVELGTEIQFLINLIIPAITDACDEFTREKGIPDDVRKTMEIHLRELFSSVSLIEINPAPNSEYFGTENSIIETIEAQQEDLRGKIHTVIRRGFKHNSKLVRKAAVTVYR